MSLSRRSFLAGSAAAIAATAAGGWTPVGRILQADAASAAACPPPPNLPAGTTAYLQAYKNWSGEIVADSIWTCAPTTPAQVVALANWARANGYRLRPRGYSHNWSPLTIPPGASCNDKVLLVDTTASLKAITVTSGSPASVTAQAGASMDDILLKLEQSGYGLTHNPAPGDLTIGGVLAIDGHGTAVPATGETLTPGHTYGSVSNLVLSITAVVWDPPSGSYVLKTFSRTDPAVSALMVHLGRAFITEVTLRVGANSRVRCQSFMDIPATELFGPPGSNGRTVDKYLKQSGRMETIWFPFTANPWLKVWTKAPTKPFWSRQVNQPYNYSFSDSLPPTITDLIGQIQTGAPWLAPTLGSVQWTVVSAGLTATLTWDIWGWAKNTSLYVKPTTLRVTANGYAILCKRADVQRVIYEFVQVYQGKVAAYKALGRYPMNGPVEIRVTGLDQAADVGVAGAQTPSLSALRPRPDHPEWDTAVWLDILTLPGTPYANQFYREIEQWALANYTGNYASLRVEWSKGWGYTDAAAWADGGVIGTTVPASLTAGQPAGQGFADARAALNSLDPHRIFTSPLLEALLP
jgi:FAD/FMN-containing dehydrogenase